GIGRTSAFRTSEKVDHVESRLRRPAFLYRSTVGWREIESRASRRTSRCFVVVRWCPRDGGDPVGDRSTYAQVLHDGFEKHVLPMLAPLGFERAELAPDARAVGWTVRIARCSLPSGQRVELELSKPPGSPDLRLIVNGGGVELKSSQADPAVPRALSLASALNQFRGLGESREGEQHLSSRMDTVLRFLAAELANTADQLAAIAPELGPRIAEARQTKAWREAPAVARELWAKRAMRSEVEDRPVSGKLVYVGASVAIVEAEGVRHTFRFDTSRVDRSASVTLADWFTTPAKTQQPMRLTIGALSLRFDQRGNLVEG
ncbi:MAG: hypothetical protein JST54_29175, partial [Deltaproteobacteria bacterium]|nr:hypothetical protein [Deltaproteobacteria bacterium]